jgi:hypothetical protein
VWLRDVTPEEQMTLVAIASLAGSLPRDLADYVLILADLNRKYFRVEGVTKPGVHNPSPGSLSLTHKVRATTQFGS